MDTDKKMTLAQYTRRVGALQGFVVWVTDMELHKKKRSLLEWRSLFAASCAAQSVTSFEVQGGIRDRVEDICTELCIHMRAHRRSADSLLFVIHAISRLHEVQEKIQKLSEEEAEYRKELSENMAAARRKALKKHVKSS
mgnify:CR=1 FL=1